MNITGSLCLPPAPVMACRQCDLLQRAVPVPRGGAAKCGRCGSILYRATHNSLDNTIAFLLAASILYGVANCFPIVELDAQGTRTTATLLEAVHALWSHDRPVVAMLVFGTTIVAPVVHLAGTLYVLLPLKFGRVAYGITAMLRLVEAVEPWNMVEVFMLGVLVSLVKLSTFATAVPGIALWSFGAVTLLMAADAASFNLDDVWARVNRAVHGEPGP